MTILNAPLVILRARFCTGLITGATVRLVVPTAAAEFVMLLLLGTVDGVPAVVVVVVVLVVVVAASVVVEVVVVVGKVVVEVLEAVVVEVSETGATGCVSCADGANCWGRGCSDPLGSAFWDGRGDGGGGGGGATVVVERINVCSRTCDWSRSKSFLTGRSLPLLPIWLN